MRRAGCAASAAVQTFTLVKEIAVMAIFDFYTTWSVVVEVGLLAFCWALHMLDFDYKDDFLKVSLLMAVIANSITVGFIGPVVMAYGDLPGSHALHIKFNAIAHALPMTLGIFAVLALHGSLNQKPSNACFLLSLSLLYACMSAYIVLPSKKGKRGLQKLRCTYGVHPAALASSSVILQFVTVGSIFIHLSTQRRR